MNILMHRRAPIALADTKPISDLSAIGFSNKAKL
jgi:hypothetical protein